jgi:hypothetical protein
LAAAVGGASVARSRAAACDPLPSEAACEKLKAGLLRPKLVSDPGDENDNT